MEAQDLHQNTQKNLLDKIASDPEIINRSVTDTGEPPVVVAPPVSKDVGPLPPPGVEGRGPQAVPVFNLLVDNVAEPEPATAAPVKKSRKWPAVAAVVLLLICGGAGAYYYAVWKPAHKTVAAAPTIQPTPVATPTATPTPTPSPTPPPTPVPTPIPAQTTVTAPVAAPTADHPQAVTVISPSGLWLRSGPDSSSKQNIIGWIPDGGTVSVDSVGSFWWHGSFRGRPGYFAVNYTK